MERSSTRPSVTRHRPTEHAVGEDGAGHPAVRAHPELPRVSGVVTRSRPACESQTLSYWPSSRTGAGVSSSASSSPGTSYSSLPCSSSWVTRSSIALTTGPSRVIPDQAVTSAAVRRAERTQVAPHDLLHVGLDQRPAEPPVDVLVDHATAALPGAARRALHQRRGRPGQLPELGGRYAGEQFAQRRTEGLLRLRAVGEELRERGEEGLPVHLPGGADALADLDLALVHRGGPLPQHQRVVRHQQVHGAAQRQEPHQ